MATYCIMCGKQRNGIAVRNDYVIEAIRLFKRNVTKDEKGSNLVVCKDCYPKYRKRRDGYTSKQALYVALGVLFLIFLVVISQTITAVVLGIMVLLVMYVMSLFNYTPDLVVRTKPEKASKSQS